MGKTVEEAHSKYWQGNNWGCNFDESYRRFEAGFAAGAAHGAAVEREAILEIIIDTAEPERSELNDVWNGALADVSLRIRQRGEKRDGE